MHQSEFPVQKVLVHKQAFAGRLGNFKMLGLAVAADGETAARLDTGQHANQYLLDLILVPDPTGGVFLRRGCRGQVNQGALVLGRELVRVLLHLFRQSNPCADPKNAAW
jgi:hypothetical protein